MFSKKRSTEFNFVKLVNPKIIKIGLNEYTYLLNETFYSIKSSSP